MFTRNQKRRPSCEIFNEEKKIKDEDVIIDLMIDAETIQYKINALAAAIEQTIMDGERLDIICVCDGAKRFVSNLMVVLNVKTIVVHNVKVNSYRGVHSEDVVDCSSRSQYEEIANADKILIIDDIYDTGKTMQYLVAKCRRMGVKNISTCVLLRRLRSSSIGDDNGRQLDHRFVGFFIDPDSFVVGYGLDYNGKYRDLPYIGKIIDNNRQ